MLGLVLSETIKEAVETGDFAPVGARGQSQTNGR